MSIAPSGNHHKERRRLYESKIDARIDKDTYSDLELMAEHLKLDLSGAVRLILAGAVRAFRRNNSRAYRKLKKKKAQDELLAKEKSTALNDHGAPPNL